MICESLTQFEDSGLVLKFGWEQVSSGLQDFFQYSSQT